MSSIRPRRGTVLLRGEAFYSSTVIYSTRSQRGIYSSAARPSTHPWRCLLLIHGDVFHSSAARFSTRPRRCLLPVRGEVSYSSAARAFTRPWQGLPPPAARSSASRDEVLYSSAVKFPTHPWRSFFTCLQRSFLLARGGDPPSSFSYRVEECGTPLLL